MNKCSASKPMQQKRTTRRTWKLKQTHPVNIINTTPNRKVFLINQNLLFTPLSFYSKKKKLGKERECHLKVYAVSESLARQA